MAGADARVFVAAVVFVAFGFASVIGGVAKVGPYLRRRSCILCSVDAGTAVKTVLANSTIQLVAVVPTIELIVAIAAVERVIAVTAVELVVATTPVK